MNVLIQMKALNSLLGSAGYSIVGTDFSTLEINPESGAVAPTEAEFLAKYAEIEAEEQAKEYQKLRAEAYPSIQEQLDMQYWDSVNGTTTWSDAIAQVKSDYPKPE